MMNSDLQAAKIKLAGMLESLIEGKRITLDSVRQCASGIGLPAQHAESLILDNMIEDQITLVLDLIRKNASDGAVKNEAGVLDGLLIARTMPSQALQFVKEYQQQQPEESEP